MLWNALTVKRLGGDSNCGGTFTNVTAQDGA